MARADSGNLISTPGDAFAERIAGVLGQSPLRPRAGGGSHAIRRGSIVAGAFALDEVIPKDDGPDFATLG